MRRYPKATSIRIFLSMPRITGDSETTDARPGHQASHFAPYKNIIGPESFFDPSLYDPSKAMRLYRPVCVGASTCTTDRLPIARLIRRRRGRRRSQIRCRDCSLASWCRTPEAYQWAGLTTGGYPVGGLLNHSILPQPRLGFAWMLRVSTRPSCAAAPASL